MSNNRIGCICFLSLIFIIGLIIVVFMYFPEYAFSALDFLWYIRLYILIVICLIVIYLLIKQRKNLHYKMMSRHNKYVEVVLFFKQRYYKRSKKYKEFEKKYLSITNLLYDLKYETSENLSEDKAFKLSWEIRLSHKFTSIYSILKNRYIPFDYLNLFLTDENDVNLRILHENFINVDSERYDLVKRIVKLALSQKTNIVFFDTLAERDKYIDILDNLGKYFFACVLFNYFIKKDNKKSENDLDQLQRLYKFSLALEVSGEANYSLNTNYYTINHYCSRKEIREKTSYSYCFDVKFTNELIRERILFKHSNLFGSVNPTEKPDTLSSLDHTFNTSDDVIFKSDEINSIFESFINTEMDVIYGYIEAKVGKKVKDDLKNRNFSL